MGKSTALKELEELIHHDYALLCRSLEMDEVLLDIYLVDPEVGGTSALGTDTRNGTPLYDSKKIVLPITYGEIAMNRFKAHDFPPKVWDRLHHYEWPEWRTNLWHETCHQVEHNILRCWKGGVEGGPCKDRAVEYMANRFEVTSKEIRSVL